MTSIQKNPGDNFVTRQKKNIALISLAAAGGLTAVANFNGCQQTKPTNQSMSGLPHSLLSSH
jgi:hypothetical protein